MFHGRLRTPAGGLRTGVSLTSIGPTGGSRTTIWPPKPRGTALELSPRELHHSLLAGSTIISTSLSRQHVLFIARSS